MGEGLSESLWGIIAPGMPMSNNEVISVMKSYTEIL